MLVRFKTDCRVGVWSTAITLTITLHNASPVKIDVVSQIRYSTDKSYDLTATKLSEILLAKVNLIY